MYFLRAVALTTGARFALTLLKYRRDSVAPWMQLVPSCWLVQFSGSRMNVVPAPAFEPEPENGDPHVIVTVYPLLNSPLLGGKFVSTVHPALNSSLVMILTATVIPAE